jgi:diguanylate cyclase (GGDEF)-like protein
MIKFTEKLNMKINSFLFLLIISISLITYIITVVVFLNLEKSTLETIRSIIGTNIIDYVIDKTKNNLLIYSILLSPLPILSALAISFLLTKRFKKITQKLSSEISKINSISDLAKLENIKYSSVFYELRELFDEINSFIKKTREIAVDRDILEFEIKILEKFIITSEVINDWKSYVSSLVKDINQIIDVRVIFSLFRISDNEFTMDFFWTSHPSEELKNYFVLEAEKKCRDFYWNHTDFRSISITHNIIPNDKCDIYNPNLISFETKSLLLENPKIGGIVGIGINSRDNKDKTKMLVVEGILTTLLNVIGSVKAISRYNMELEYYSTRDFITGLFNQRVFWEMLKYEIARSKRYNKRFSVVIIDIDNFKFINDNFGHDVGDSILREVGEIIKRNVRLGDVVARYSGDEFVLILFESNQDDAHATTERILATIEKFEYKLDDKIIKITASAGYVVFPDHGNEDREIFAIADAMLSQAKISGKNRALSPSKEDISRVRKETSEKSYQIVRAIEENRIVPYFQPIFNLRTSTVDMYEVLCRIDLGDRVLSAYEFIDIAEKTGSIFKIDYLMIENAIRKLVETKNKSSLFINLSPKTLIISEFIPKVIGITDKYDIDAGRIVFELTERDTVKNILLLEKFVFNLKEKGYKFAIDDFGAGFSSYDYIKRFPVDYVKIDGDFIRNITKSSKDLAIVESLLVLTKEFKIKTVAEFVENEEILEVVKGLGVDYAQGYFVGRPSENLA